jgi:hypothetical protein
MLFRKREILKNPDERDLHVAYLGAVCVADQVSALVGGKPRTFEQIFPPPRPEIESDPEQTRKICAAHGLNLIEE